MAQTKERKTPLAALIKKIPNGPAADSMLLAATRGITAVMGLVVAKFLSVFFTLEQYGTYSAAMLVVSTVTSLSILGLTDATNYFYNKPGDALEKQRRVSTVFAMQYVSGLVAGFIVLALTLPICRYFDNDALRPLLAVVAFMPLFRNLLAMLQVLFISIGRAKLMALKNFIASFVRLLAVALTTVVIKDVKVLLGLLLISDILQTLVFMGIYARKCLPVSIRRADRTLIRPILSFALPMAASVVTASLVRDSDKYIVGLMDTTENLGIYTAAARTLPFDVIAKSMVTVLVPVVIRRISAGEFPEAKKIFRNYLRVAMLITWILILGAMVYSPELLPILYDVKYLPGLPVFVLYLLVDMIQFGQMSLILTARGKTRRIMYCSIIGLAANLALNVVLYRIMGMPGPAVSTVLVTLGMTLYFLIAGSHEIDGRITDLLDLKEMGVIIVHLALVGAAGALLRQLLIRVLPGRLPVLAVGYLFCLGTLLLLERKRIVSGLREINRNGK